MTRLHNFGAGPGVLPLEVIKACKKNLEELGSSGLGLMETSHRSPVFQAIVDEADARLRRLLRIPDEYSVLFLQGGASLQFHMSALNLLDLGEHAEIIITGTWSQKAYSEIGKLGGVRAIWDGAEEGFTRVPDHSEYSVSEDAAYIHYTSNNTIYGTQFHEMPDSGGKPVVVDASSDITGARLDVSAHDVVYAGAQKNLGPSGVTVVILSPWALKKGREGLPSMLDYKVHESKGSLFNTPNTYGIFVLKEVLGWIEREGGVQAAIDRNAAKASLLYGRLDSSDFWAPHALKSSRSVMNATWRISDHGLEAAFLEGAEERGLMGLKGHRSVGGIRASMYNALELSSVEALVAWMAEFESMHS